MIALLYCGNRKVFRGLLLSLTSITLSCPEPLEVHIATMDWTEMQPVYTAITEEQTAFLEVMLRRANPQSRVIRHDMRALFLEELAQSPNAESVYTPYTLLRLLIDRVDDLPDRLLYLDTDTLAMKSIVPLYRFPVEEYNFAAARDYLGKFFIGPRYMNAGVMLFHVVQLRRTGLLVRARELCRTKKYAFPDQDVLNHCETHKCFLPSCFNEQKALHADTVIRHFSKTIRWLPFFHTINVKPWDEEGLHTVYKTHAYDDILEAYHPVAAQAQQEGLL